MDWPPMVKEAPLMYSSRRIQVTGWAGIMRLILPVALMVGGFLVTDRMLRMFGQRPKDGGAKR